MSNRMENKWIKETSIIEYKSRKIRETSKLMDIARIISLTSTRTFSVPASEYVPFSSFSSDNDVVSQYSCSNLLDISRRGKHYFEKSRKPVAVFAQGTE